MVDTHFHSLTMREKGFDVESTLKQNFDDGLAYAIDAGLHPDDLAARHKLLSQFGRFFFTTGISPFYASDASWRDMLLALRKQIAGRRQEDRLVAVGETGLDWHWDYGSRSDQMELFAAQVEIADRASMPVIIHNREADTEILEILHKAKRSKGGIMHCFSSDLSFARAAIDLGFRISFSGNITYKNTDAIREAAVKIPIEMLLIETDSPYLPPHPLRGKPNHPGNIQYTYQAVADLRGMHINELEEQVQTNMFDLIDPKRLLR